MDELPKTLELTSATGGTAVTAEYAALTRELAKSEIDSKWWVLPSISRSLKQQEPDHSWNWAKAVGEHRNEKWYEHIAVQTPDGRVHGAMQYRIDARSFVDDGAGAVYIEGLATAPRNRPWLVATPEFRGVGNGLLLRAVLHSYILGFGGRVNLISFDDVRSVGFYENRGLAIVGRDDELPMLELAPDAAQQWLREVGYEV